VEEIHQGQGTRTVVVRRPAPGRWRFRVATPETRVRILSQRFFLHGDLIAPGGDAPIRRGDGITVSDRLSDMDGSPLRELPGYPPSPAMILVKPDGGRAHLAMERRPDLRLGVFRARSETDCDLAERFWIEMVVATRDLAGRMVTVMRDRWSEFAVEAAGQVAPSR